MYGAHAILNLELSIRQGKETEHNWALREQAIQQVRGMLKGEVHVRYPEPFLAVLKDGFIQWSLKTASPSFFPSSRIVIMTIYTYNI